MSGAFRSIDVVGRNRHVDQVGDARDVEVLLQLVLLGRGCDGDPDTDVRRMLEQIGDCGEGPQAADNAS